MALCHVDASVLFVRNLEDYLDEFSAGTHRFVVFRKVSGGLDAKSDRLITSVAPLLDKKIGYASMIDLVQSVVGGKATMTLIPALPIISTRTKKLEEAERATFTANDGSAEGRRLEREKRRAEHNREHNVKPKTPEEIQEMEQRRRIRMEQEAGRWSMAPDECTRRRRQGAR